MVDGRSDIYALGCVLYEMLAGEPPFSGPTPHAVIAKRLSSSPVPLRLVRDTVPDGVDDAVMAALSKVTADRPQTAAEFARMLTAPMGATADRHSAARTRASRGTESLPAAAGAVTLTLQRRSLFTAGIAASLGLLLLIAGTVWYVGRHASRSSDADTPAQTAAASPCCTSKTTAPGTTSAKWPTA